MGIVKNKEFKMDLKGHFAKLKADLAPMTFKEKVDHIWTYYKEYMLVVFCVLFIIIGALVAFLTPRKTILLAGAQCNIRMTTEGYDYVTTEFHQQILGGAKGSVDLHSFELQGQYTVETVERTTQSYYTVTSYVEAKQLDYMLVDTYSFTYFGSDRLYIDLRDILTPQELEELDAQGLILYEQLEGETDRIPKAINIAGLPFSQDHLNTTDCYLVFMRNTPRLDQCRQLWDHINNYQKENNDE